MKNYYFMFLFFVFSYNLGGNFLTDANMTHSGYTNLYGVNRISDGSVIKLPFRLLTYDFNCSYKNFSIDTKWGLEHKIKLFNSSQSLNQLAYDLISINNIDYKGEFREYYLSFFPSFGEIKLGKQIHAWGAVDASSPIDILNPINYYYLFTDADETKIGRESLVIDLFFDAIKIELIAMPNHAPNYIPIEDPDFPIVLPVAIKKYQFLDWKNPIEYGGYIKTSLNNIDLSAYYFSGYDRNFNLYATNIFANSADVVTVADTVFSYRKTDMYALSNVSFIGDLTIRADFAYFKTDAGDLPVSNRPYFGKDILADYTSFPTYITTIPFNISAEYYQYNLQIESELLFNIDCSAQLFGHQDIKIKGDSIIVSTTNLDINLDSRDFFYPGMGSSMATLAKNGLLFNFKKSFLDDTIELQLISLIDTKDKGQLNQFKATFNIIDNLSLSFLYYKGKGNRIKYPDITFIDNDGDGINDDFINNNTGRDMPGLNGDGIVDANMINESLLYPFNAMEDFSHIRFQLQYFF